MPQRHLPEAHEPQTRARVGGHLTESRVIFSIMTCAWCIAAAGLLINAIVRTQNLTNKIRALIPPPTVISINASSIRIPAIFATVAVLFILIIAFCELLLCRKKHVNGSAGAGLACLLIFFLLWLLGDMVALTYRYATREIQLSMFVENNPLPGDVVQDIKNSIGFEWKWRQMNIWLVAIIIPWIAWLFTTLLTIVVFVAWGKNDVDPPPTAQEKGTLSADHRGPIEHIAGSRTTPHGPIEGGASAAPVIPEVTEKVGAPEVTTTTTRVVQDATTPGADLLDAANSTVTGGTSGDEVTRVGDTAAMTVYAADHV